MVVGICCVRVWEWGKEDLSQVPSSEGTDHCTCNFIHYSGTLQVDRILWEQFAGIQAPHLQLLSSRTEGGFMQVDLDSGGIDSAKPQVGVERLRI
jgi:hypothetical protein